MNCQLFYENNKLMQQIIERIESTKRDDACMHLCSIEYIEYDADTYVHEDDKRFLLFGATPKIDLSLSIFLLSLT